MIAETTTVITDLPLIKIRTDGGTQSRAILDMARVQEYEQIIKDSGGVWPFPSLTVYYDGKEYWLADGFHRRSAAARSFLHYIPCEVRQGTRRDAVLFACGANATHGLPRNDADKRRAVFTLLDDTEWSAWSDREIARRCAVSATFVGKLRAQSSTVHVDSRTYTRNGQVQAMNTAEIGKTAVSEPLDEDRPMRALREALSYNFEGKFADGATNEEIKTAVQKTFRLGAGETAEGGMTWGKGTVVPEFSWKEFGENGRSVVWRGADLINRVRKVFEIPFPQTAVSPTDNDNLPASVWLLQSTMAGWFIPDWGVQDRLNYVNTALRSPGAARDDLMSQLTGLDYVHEDAITALENLKEIYEGQLNAKRRKPETNYQEWLEDELEAIDEEVEEMLAEAPPQTTAESNKRPTPPPGWLWWDGKTCPSGCVKNIIWQPARFQVEDEEWSKYRTGVCNECGSQLWADYGVPFAYYYNPQTTRAKAADPRLEIISNIREQIEVMYTNELIGDGHDENLVVALAGVNAGLFKVITLLKRAGK